ncbi:SMP-30/gluconolactonase/LRE family protein [Bacteroidota bacterium]
MKYLISILMVILGGISGTTMAQMQTIPFDTSHWDLSRAKVTEYLGREALAGGALLKNVELRNGIIEVDMAVKHARSYPGINFRAVNPENYERIYIRPHRAKFYQDAIQYEAAFNGIDSWQLYNGPGKTANAEFPYDVWFPVKLEIIGTQCRVFINDAREPSLIVADLQHGEISGGIELEGPLDGSAWFSNFRITTDTTLEALPLPTARKQHGFINDWEISQPMKYADIELDQTPASQSLSLTWKKIESLPSGLVDISRHSGRLGNDPDCIWAKTTIYADQDERRLFAFGYSDYITIFCNGELLYQGTSAYQSRSPSFLGIVGLFDNITLPLKRGENELLINVAEVFGGWGFTFRDASSPFLAKGVSKVWEVHGGLRMPESVIYDEKRDLLYVTNYYNNGMEFISKVSPTGKILSAVWISGVLRPTGMAMFNDHLFVVDRRGINEIDPDKGEIINKIPVPGASMLNDIAIDSDGTIYVTDSRANALYRITDGQAEVIMQGKGLSKPNGLALRDGLLYVGNAGDGCLFTVDLISNELKQVVCLEEGSIIDGLTFDSEGNLLISDYTGRLLRYSAEGEVTELINMEAQEKMITDFGFISKSGLVIIPSDSDSRLVAFKLGD